MVYSPISTGLDWYIKWFASIVLIFGALTTAIDKMFDYVSKMPDNIKTD